MPQAWSGILSAVDICRGVSNPEQVESEGVGVGCSFPHVFLEAILYMPQIVFKHD